MEFLGSLVVDRRDSPVVILRERGPSASIADFIAAFESVLAEQQRVVTLHDARAIVGWDVGHRKTVHEWLKKRAFVIKQCIVAHGAIVTGVGQRSMSASVFWGTGFDRNIRYFEAPTQALAWAKDTVRAELGRAHMG